MVYTNVSVLVFGNCYILEYDLEPKEQEVD